MRYSIQFVAHAKGTDPLNECRLSIEGGYSAIACGYVDMHSYAFLIDPPPADSPTIPTVLCSTECPFANGQQHITSVGEVRDSDAGDHVHSSLLIHVVGISYGLCNETWDRPNLQRPKKQLKGMYGSMCKAFCMPKCGFRRLSEYLLLQ
jgi:hypothetical protein